jgi:hypothetical protein
MGMGGDGGAALGIAESAASQAVLGALDRKADEISHNCNQPLGTRPKAKATRQSSRLKRQATTTPGDDDADTDEADEADAASSDNASEDDADLFNPDDAGMEEED